MKLADQYQHGISVFYDSSIFSNMYVYVCACAPPSGFQVTFWEVLGVIYLSLCSCSSTLPFHLLYLLFNESSFSLYTTDHFCILLLFLWEEHFWENITVLGQASRSNLSWCPCEFLAGEINAMILFSPSMIFTESVLNNHTSTWKKH